jgi:hypothetical protein
MTTRQFTITQPSVAYSIDIPQAQMAPPGGLSSARLVRVLIRLGSLTPTSSAGVYHHSVTNSAGEPVERFYWISLLPAEQNAAVVNELAQDSLFVA